MTGYIVPLKVDPGSEPQRVVPMYTLTLAASLAYLLGVTSTRAITALTNSAFHQLPLEEKTRLTLSSIAFSGPPQLSDVGFVSETLLLESSFLLKCIQTC